jgi:hypothetical protein
VSIISNSSPGEEDYRIIPKREYKRALRNPYFRKLVIDSSLYEDEENSYYAGILNTVAEHCVGTVPLILGSSENQEANRSVENKWLLWAALNGIGESIRVIRREACKTGLGIGIPYVKEDVDPDDPVDPIGLRIRIVSSTKLSTPMGASVKDRIFNGIEYDSNWDPKKIYIQEFGSYEPKEYNVKDILFWTKYRGDESTWYHPECGPAFCLYPSVRRILNSVVAAEEFKASMPMAVELDPSVYAPEDAKQVPTGSFKYQPNTVPTLPPGTKLVGMPPGTSSVDKVQFMKFLIAAAARCVNMPMNIAMGDSSGHNMATAAIDIQPWQDRVKIDRFDFSRISHSVFNDWYRRAILVSGYLDIRARSKFSYELGYDKTFEHPDPQKRANSRSVDLASGATTLHRIFSEQGLNVERELNKEAKTLGISREDLNKILISIRASAPKMLEEKEEIDEQENENENEDQDQQQRR